MRSNHRKSTPKMERTKYPGIYKRGSRFVVVWEHRGQQHKSFHGTLAEAKEAQGQRRQPGGRKPVSREPFEQHAKQWLASYQGRTNRGLAESTRVSYRRLIEQKAVPFFRGYRLAEIERPDVRAFVVHLQQSGLAPLGVVKVLTPLKALLATAVEDGVIPVNPTQGLIVNRRDESDAEPEAKAMTRKELGELLAELPEPWRLFFELLAHTGLRISEALGLDWRDIQFGKNPKLTVRRQYYRGKLSQLKSRNARRDLPLAPGLARRLWAARPAHGKGPMFSTRNGTRYLDRNVRRVLDKATEGTPLEWVSFHAFRHTAASLLFESGKNIAQVSKWLGHADPAFTLRTYVHLLDAGLGDAGFLDGAVVVGKGWAREGPKTAANARPAALVKSAPSSEDADQPQAPAEARVSL